MKVRLDPEAAEIVRDLPTPVKARIKKAVALLAKDPFGHGGTSGIRKLQSKVGTIHRLKVGAWRVAYQVKRDEVRIVHIFPREDGYGWMERFGFL